MATETAPVVATGIDCVCYLAKDFARAKDFYQNKLGLKPSMEGDNWMEFELGDGTAFALAKLPGDQWYPTGGVMFAVPDVPAALEALRSTGIKVHSDVMDYPGCSTAWCDDTEGNNFALHHRK